MEIGYSDSRLNRDKRKILVIEDEIINRMILENILRETYDVVFAETGAQGLEILNEQFRTLSLVLLDLNLPDMYGVDILRQIKADAVTAVLPFIVMTADQEAEVQCLNLGATDFIAKPYPKPEVCWRASCARSSSLRGGTFSAGPSGISSPACITRNSSSATRRSSMTGTRISPPTRCCWTSTASTS